MWLLESSREDERLFKGKRFFQNDIIRINQREGNTGRKSKMQEIQIGLAILIASVCFSKGNAIGKLAHNTGK